jgi:hypothetical protein
VWQLPQRETVSGFLAAQTGHSMDWLLRLRLTSIMTPAESKANSGLGYSVRYRTIARNSSNYPHACRSGHSAAARNGVTASVCLSACGYAMVRQNTVSVETASGTGSKP